MKLYISLLLLFIITTNSFAQWSTLNSTTTLNLYDVDFINPDYGVIVGDGGTILLTNDGGLSWNNINNGVNGDVYSVKLMNADTIFVSTYNMLTVIATIYKTENGGLTWSPLFNDITSNHKTDLATPDTITLFASGSNLTETANYGISWDTLLTNTGSIISLPILKFADSQTGHISGNVSGFAGYSSYFFRSEDFGKHWYANDLFSYLNSDALTAMCFISADTAILFMNDFNMFIPSAINRVVMATNFQLSFPVPGDTVYSFTSQMLNPAMPAYINDAMFISSNIGFAFGNDGNVYKTANGGAAWMNDYIAGAPLFASASTNGTVYAVGDSGRVIKFIDPTLISENAFADAVKIYPSIADDYFTVESPINNLSYKITNMTGEIIESGTLQAAFNKLNVKNFPAGNYLLSVRGNTSSLERKFVIVH
jgi:photosystem II stability/assembly factor-like uncharacterized protein